MESCSIPLVTTQPRDLEQADVGERALRYSLIPSDGRQSTCYPSVR